MLLLRSWLQPTVAEAKDEQNYQGTNEKQRVLGIKGLETSSCAFKAKDEAVMERWGWGWENHTQ